MVEMASFLAFSPLKALSVTANARIIGMFLDTTVKLG